MNTVKVLVMRDYEAWKRGDELLLPLDRAQEAVEAGWAAFLLVSHVKIIHKPPLEAKAVK